MYEDTSTVVLGTTVQKAGHDPHCSVNLAGDFTVRLAAPIGNQVVLDALTGYPIMCTDDLLQPLYR